MPEPTGKNSAKVFQLSRQSRCFNCDIKLEPGSIAKLEQGKDEREVLCRHCAELDALEFLPSGNAKVTQLAKKYSKHSLPVVRWSELWKTYERQGLLVEPQSIDRAERELGIKASNRESNHN